MSASGNNTKDSVPDERAPLLRDRPNNDEGTEHANEDEGSKSDSPSTLSLAITLGSCWIGVFFQALDSTIIATLAGPISESFNSFALFSWLATAYLIANAALQPLSGKLTDIYGRRAGLLWSNVFFLAGNLICGLAKSSWVMILGRVVAGIGGGCLTTITTFLASDLVPLRQRGLWQGFGNLAFGTGNGLGGVFGGWVNDISSWRYAFLVQVPVMILSGIIVFFTVKVPPQETNKSKIKRVDFLGSGMLVITVVLLLLGVNSGGTIVPWKHPLVYVSLPLSLVALCGFVYVEEKVASEPIIPTSLLLHRTVGCACLANWFFSMAIFTLLFYGPIFYQVQGVSATLAGARYIPCAVGMGIGSIGTGILIKRSGKYIFYNFVTAILFVVAFALLLVFMKPGQSIPVQLTIFFAAGLGMSGMLTITLLAFVAAVDQSQQAVVTSASYAFRSTGSTIGTSISSAVFQNLFKSALPKHLGCQDGLRSAEECAAIVSRITSDIIQIPKESPDIREQAMQAFLAAIEGVWWTALGFAIIGAVSGLGMKQHKLYSNLQRE